MARRLAVHAFLPRQHFAQNLQRRQTGQAKARLPGIQGDRQDGDIALRRIGAVTCQQDASLPKQFQSFGIAGGGGVMALFASHPPLEDRIAALSGR